jgi:hypothetical protein
MNKGVFNQYFVNDLSSVKIIMSMNGGISAVITRGMVTEFM